MNDEEFRANSAAMQLITSAVKGAAISERVDAVGIDEFIFESAVAAAASGFATGFGGPATLIFGVPVDIANVLLQKVRVSAAVLYDQTGCYDFSVRDVLLFTAVNAGATVVTEGAKVVVKVAAAHALRKAGEQELVKLLLKQVSKKLAEQVVAKAIPIFGGIVGAGVNFMHVSSYGHAIRVIDTFD